jgi:hypothetical protein
MTDMQADPNAEPGGDLIGDGDMSGGLGAPASSDSAATESSIRNPFAVDGDDVSEAEAPAADAPTDVAPTGDPTLDSDGDGMGNADEAAVGTDAFESDTDGDGIGDGEEAVIGTDPFEVDNEDYAGQEGVDSDGDGLSDAVEDAVGYDPENRDSDEDGLIDGHEADLHTDPLTDDSDNDGVIDGDELDAGTDPLTADDDLGGDDLGTDDLATPELDAHDHGSVDPDAFSDQFGDQLDMPS